MRTLILTTPPMKGEDVKKAQKALKAYGLTIGKSGVYDEQTARSTSAAKYRLGYRDANINKAYDGRLHSYLTYGKQTPLMKRRAAKRMEKRPLRDAALEIAKQYIGVKEMPANSNEVMFSHWYGIIGPWCAMFVTYCYSQAGAKHFKKGVRWAYCPFLLSDARKQNYGLNLITKDKVQAGDIVLFDWKGDGIADHVGLVVDPPNKSGNFKTIEGNTSISNDSNGGQVMYRDRNTSNVIGFVRVWE